MSRKLTESELASELANLPEWRLDNGEIVRIATYDDFKQAMSFVNEVADLAAAANHHPDIDIRYNRVRLALVTHDSGGITQRDVDLASKISAATEERPNL
jgi:4a-hydroxytetrahydrobiopterin dehydratase